MTKQHWGVRDDFFNPAEATLDEINVLAARNEVTGVQVRLAASQDFTLVLDRANWLHPLGFLPRLRLEVRFPGLPDGAVECFAVGYVEGDDRRQWMEYLDRAGYAEAPAHRPQAVYVRLRIPVDTRKGLYVGQVRLFSQSGFEDEKLAWQGGINLHVAAAALPDVKDWSFHLNLWQHLTSIARFHHVPLWSEAHYALIDRYYASLAQLGQKAVSLIAAEIPWSGQRGFRDLGYPSYLFEHAVIDITRDPQGKLHFDYTKMDRLMALAARHAIDRQIDLFGLVNIWLDEPFGFGKVIPDAPDAVRLRCWDAASGSFTYLRQVDELRQFLAALQEHFQALGLLERVRLEADEPHDLEKFKTSLEFIRQAAPGLRLAVAIDHFEFMEVAPPELLDFIPVLPHLCKDPQLSTRLIELAHRPRRAHALLHLLLAAHPQYLRPFAAGGIRAARLADLLPQGGWLLALGLLPVAGRPLAAGQLPLPGLACGRYVFRAARQGRRPGGDAALRRTAHRRAGLRAAQTGRTQSARGRSVGRDRESLRKGPAYQRHGRFRRRNQSRSRRPVLA